MSIIYNGITIHSIRFTGADDNHNLYNNKVINEVIYNGKLVYARPINFLTMSFDGNRNVTSAQFDYQTQRPEAKRSFVVYTMHCRYMDALGWGGAHTGVSIYSSEAEINTAMSNDDLRSSLNSLDWSGNGVFAVCEKVESMISTPTPNAIVDLYNNKRKGNASIGSCFQSMIDLELTDVIYPIVGSVNVRYNARFFYWDWNFVSQATIVSPSQRRLLNYDYRAGGDARPREIQNVTSKIQRAETGRIRDYGNINDLKPNSTCYFTAGDTNFTAKFVFGQTGWGSSSVRAMTGSIG